MTETLVAVEPRSEDTAGVLPAAFVGEELPVVDPTATSAGLSREEALVFAGLGAPDPGGGG